MNVVATGGGRFIEVQGTGEEGTFSREQLAELTAMALGGIESISLLQSKALASAGLDKLRPASTPAD
jgi:ribonuclease PH